MTVSKGVNGKIYLTSTGMFDRQAGTGDAGSLTAKWAVKTISFETACLTWSGGEVRAQEGQSVSLTSALGHSNKYSLNLLG